MSLHNPVMSTVQILVLIIIAVFIIVMFATFSFFFHLFFIIPTSITPGLDGQEVFLSSIIPRT
jgi:signal peptidase I